MLQKRTLISLIVAGILAHKERNNVRRPEVAPFFRQVSACFKRDFFSCITQGVGAVHANDTYLCGTCTPIGMVWLLY
jgi:hypothetical protein